MMTSVASSMKFMLEDLRDEREAARRPEVALDDLDVVVLGDELDVEGAV